MRASEHVDPVKAPLPPSVAGDDDDWETKEPTAVPLVAATSNTNSSSNTNAATEAFGKMQLTPPPPAQDGGAYERTPQSQPGPFDPSSAYAQPVSAATASAASALNGGGAPMDPVLVACLDNPRERLTVLKFEDQIVRFIRSSREPQLIFPPLSSYHRLIIHRLAERCCLEHQTADYNPYAQHGGYDGNSSRVVTLFKTSQSVVPSVLLIDLSADRQQPMVTPASAPKIMVRKRGTTRPGANGGRGGNGQDAKNAQRTMQDREKAYAEARARIFGEDNTAATDGTSSSSSTTSSSSPAAESSSSGGVKFNSQQAAGPDGSRGFGGRGRGRGAAGDKSTTPQRQDRSDAVQPQSSSSASTRAVAVQNTQNWKESKVLWRNREQELNDPDFTRNHDAYRPSRNHNGNGSQRYNAPPPPPPSQQHGVNRYPLPSQQQQMDYYDGSSQQRQPYSGGGYNQQQQPPLPGRRFPAGEFNRLDHTGMPPQRSPPPPPDHFRGGLQHIHQPPGRGYTSPHNRHHQQYPSNNFRSHGGADSRHGGGGYNDDFPPLGGK
uniref:SUZ domain-containing protein n=1 Tax=Globisporangium ultimum (strain ATCC 200006 / CBS 805.95 / DAOM BR144) TaxID=431595 RepID=K3WHI7_GLOUD